MGEVNFPQYSSTWACTSSCPGTLEVVVWEKIGVKASDVTKKFVKIHLVLVQSSRKEDVTNSSGNFWVTCGYFAQKRDLAQSACASPFRSLFSVADWTGITLLQNSERAGCARMKWMWIYSLIERKKNQTLTDLDFSVWYCWSSVQPSHVLSSTVLWALLPQEIVQVACGAAWMCVPSRHWPQICLCAVNQPSCKILLFIQCFPLRVLITKCPPPHFFHRKTDIGDGSSGITACSPSGCGIFK